MALNIPLNAPLTETQAELTAKIGSMKSLLALPFNKNRNIPKDKQISTFDYLLKILRVMGIDPKFLFQVFLERILNNEGKVLAEKILKAVAKTLAKKGRKLGEQGTTSPMTESKIKEYSDSNYLYLNNSSAGSSFKNAIAGSTKLIAKKLTFMIFGPGNPQSNIAKILVGNDANEINRLSQETVCCSNLFNVSNNPYERNEDLEYNRIKTLQGIKEGNVSFKITCQGVEVSLPERPEAIFGDPIPGVVQSKPITPAESLNLVINHVENQTQRANNEKNAASAGKSFAQTMVEKLFSYIVPIIQPFLVLLFDGPGGISSMTGGVGLNSVYFSGCDMMNDPDNEEKKSFASILINLLLKLLLSILLLYVIKEFKRLIKNYFARTAVEKFKRKQEKIKLRFRLFSKVSDKSKSVPKFRAASESLSGILSAD